MGGIQFDVERVLEEDATPARAHSLEVHTSGNHG
jgi:hypothetical protein